MASSAHPPLPPRPFRRALPRWLGPLVAVVALAGAGVTFGSAYWGTYQLRREAARLARERDALVRQNAQLREEIRLLQRPEYIERLAREQLGLVRPGEIAVILVEPTPAPPAGAADDGLPRRGPGQGGQPGGVR
jgi:cell division protein FtsL